jgi:hypothetical protein
MIATRAIDARARVVLRQRLLRRPDDPDPTVAEIFEILGQSLEIEDLGLIAADILTNLVNDEQDVLFAGRLMDDVDHLLDAVIHQVDDIAACGGKSLLGAEQRRIEPVGDAGEQAVSDQLVILEVSPGLARLLPKQRLELGESTVLL